MRLLGDVEFHRQGLMAAVFSTAGFVAITTAGILVWQWGHWAWIPGVASAIGFLVFFGVVDQIENYQRMKDMTLDVGYVRSVRNVTRVAQDYEYEDQHIWIAESVESDFSRSREYGAVDSLERFPVERGDPVVVAHKAGDYTLSNVKKLGPPIID